MFLLGLTGDIAAGKSTIATLLEARGAAVLDADKLVHELYGDPEFAPRVAEIFEGHFWDSGANQVRSLLTPEGVIDRAALGALVFRDAQALRRLEAVVHPAVAALRASKLDALRARVPRPAAVVIEAVKLIESGQHRDCDVVWWIRVSRETQMRRLMEQRGLGEMSASARLASQPEASTKRQMAGTVPLVEIPNDGSLAELEALVEREWQQLGIDKTPAQ
jgi:dephospho-CoA kinase